MPLQCFQGFDCCLVNSQPFPKQAQVFTCLQSFKYTRKQFLFFPQYYYTLLVNFLPYSSNLKFSSANCLNWERSKICFLGKGYYSPNNLKTFVINSFPNKSLFLRVSDTSRLRTPWDNEKLLVTSNFSFSHSVFYPFGKLSAISIKFEIVVCKLFQFG